LENGAEEVLFYVANYYSKAKLLYKVVYSLSFRKCFLKQDSLFGFNFRLIAFLQKENYLCKAV